MQEDPASRLTISIKSDLLHIPFLIDKCGEYKPSLTSIPMLSYKQRKEDGYTGDMDVSS